MVRGCGIFDVGVVKGWEWGLLYRLDGVEGREGWCGDRLGWGEAYCGDGVELGVSVVMDRSGGYCSKGVGMWDDGMGVGVGVMIGWKCGLN